MGREKRTNDNFIPHGLHYRRTKKVGSNDERATNIDYVKRVKEKRTCRKNRFEIHGKKRIGKTGIIFDRHYCAEKVKYRHNFPFSTGFFSFKLQQL